MKTKILNIALAAILVICVVTGIGRFLPDIASKNAEIEKLSTAIREQKLKNNEQSSLNQELKDPESKDDVYEMIAEDNGFAKNNETVYKDVTGN